MEQEFHFFEEQDVLIEEESEEGSEGSGTGGGERTLKVRLDKWLWAARFFKTRALARAAVEAGRVFYNGERSKPTREIEIGALLQVRLGRVEKTVTVKGLSTRRRSTEEALSLFEETEESKALRESHSSSFGDDRHFQNQFNSSSYQENSREHRQGRFLRRSFNRQDPSSPSNQTASSSSSDAYPQEESEGNLDPEEQQPLHNDSSFPYPQRREPNYRSDYSGYRNQSNHGGGYRNQDPRNRMQNNRGYRNYDSSGQRPQENNYYRQQEGGQRAPEGYGHRTPDNSGYRNQPPSHYNSSYDSGHREQNRNQDNYGNVKVRNQDPTGYRNQPQNQHPRNKKQEDEFENQD